MAGLGLLAKFRVCRSKIKHQKRPAEGETAGLFRIRKPVRLLTRCAIHLLVTRGALVLRFIAVLLTLTGLAGFGFSHAILLKVTTIFGGVVVLCHGSILSFLL